MLHPDVEIRRIDDEIGYGLFARRPILRGTIVWVLDALDRELEPAEYRRLHRSFGEALSRYTYVDRRGLHVLNWDLSRFMNHGCDPNCLSPGLDLEIAVRDIARDEELRDDYATLNPRDTFECACGSPRCRGTVGPEDVSRVDEWDAAIRAAFPDVGRVDQPLWRWVREKRRIEAALDDPARIPSIARNFAPRRGRRGR